MQVKVVYMLSLILYVGSGFLRSTIAIRNADYTGSRHFSLQMGAAVHFQGLFLKLLVKAINTTEMVRICYLLMCDVAGIKLLKA